MVSYAHADETETVGRIEQLRGFHVVRDMESFRTGRATESEMADGIDCDVLVVHLAPNALKSDAVIESEVKSSLRSYNTTGRPVVVIVPHGIGSSRTDVDAAITGRLPYSANVSWGDVSADPAPLTSDEAAAVTAKALHSLFGAGRGPARGCWELKVATRGSRSTSAGLLVDATDMVGGDGPRPGTADDWGRIYAGLRSLEETLRAHGSRRRLDVTLAAHLTAAVATGFVSRREWQLCARDDKGRACQIGSTVDCNGFDTPPVQPGVPTDERLFVEVAIADREIEHDVEAVIERTGMPRARLRVGRHSAELMTPDEMAAGAAGLARLIKDVRRQNGARRVDLSISTPAAFAALLGSQLNAVAAPVVLHEQHDDDYIETLTLDAR